MKVDGGSVGSGDSILNDALEYGLSKVNGHTLTAQQFSEMLVKAGKSGSGGGSVDGTYLKYELKGGDAANGKGSGSGAGSSSGAGKPSKGSSSSTGSASGSSGAGGQDHHDRHVGGSSGAGKPTNGSSSGSGQDLSSVLAHGIKDLKNGTITAGQLVRMLNNASQNGHVNAKNLAAQFQGAEIVKGGSSSGAGGQDHHDRHVGGSSGAGSANSSLSGTGSGSGRPTPLRITMSENISVNGGHEGSHNGLGLHDRQFVTPISHGNNA